MNSTTSKTIAFVLYPGLTVLDLVGPLQVISALSKINPQFQPVVVAERIEPHPTDTGMMMIPDKTFAQVPHPDVIVVPGGGEPTLRAMNNPAIRSYVRSAAETAQFVTSVCTGALILGSVGLLEGRPATTHWAYRDVLESYGARYQRTRWVEDDKFILSAGVSAGIDMGLYLTRRLTDEATMRQVQLAIQYDPAPPYGRIDYSRMGFMARILTLVMRLRAPFLTAKPKRLTAQGL